MTEDLVAVLLADVVDNTTYCHRYGIDAAKKKVGKFVDLATAITEDVGGKFLKRYGDAVACEFETVPNALAAAERIQNDLASWNARRADKDEEIHVRIGVDYGPREGLVMVAEEVSDRARGGEVAVTKRAVDQAKYGDFERCGRVAVRGRVARLDVYRWVIGKMDA